MMAKTLALTDNIQIPQIGFGTYGLGSNATEAVLHALRTGYRHIDTADIYGSHENIAKAIPLSGVKREEIFITTKLWSNSLSKDQVEPTVDRFLRELNTGVIDLLLIHWPSRSVPLEETLAAMDKQRQAGKVRAIGVSNFKVSLMKLALATGFPVCNNQIEYNLNHRPIEVLDFCKDNKVTVTAYSPLEEGSGKSSKLVSELAMKYDRSNAEILLAWLIQKGMIAIPRSSNPKHIETNLHSLDLSLEAEDAEKLDGV